MTRVLEDQEKYLMFMFIDVTIMTVCALRRMKEDMGQRLDRIFGALKCCDQ